MELENLKKVWKRQQPDEELHYSKQEILMLLNNKMMSFEKDIRSRDRRELIACAFVGIAFGILFFFIQSLLSKLGCAVIILSAIAIAYRLKRAQPNKVSQSESCNHSIGNHLKQERKNVQTQKKMMKNIAWWYILPICLGLVLFTLGTSWYLTIKIAYISLVLIMGLAIWYLNQWAISQRLDPLLDEINDSITLIETEP